MSSIRSSNLILGFTFTFTVLIFLISPALSLTCSSQKFTNNYVYTNCTDLPSLSSYLHWTYDPAKSSLSIAFIAPPATSSGWISWGINPTGTGMIGTQALVALRESNGSMTANTYNISSFNPVIPGKIAFNVSNATAEYSGGVMMIFATLAVPKNATVNQVWQVGGSVTGGLPGKHELKPANLMANGTLVLTTEAAQSNSTTGGGGATTNSTTPSASASPSGSGRIRFSGNVASSIFLLFLGIFCF